MLRYDQLQKNVTKVLLPNGCIGVVTMISPIKTMQGGLLRGRDKVKVAYTTKRGQTEAWFQLRDLRTYKLVPVKVNTDIQPVEKGKESWKSPDTFNGVQVIKGTAMTQDVIVPDVIELPAIELNSVELPKPLPKDEGVGSTILELDEKIGKLLEDDKKIECDDCCDDEKSVNVSINDLFNTYKKNHPENGDDKNEDNDEPNR